MKVCFTCVTVYHIFVSFILSMGEYKNCSKTLVISDFSIKSCSELVTRLRHLSIWDEIILIQEKDTPATKVESQVNNVLTREFDILHFFSYGFLSSRIFMNNISARTRVILTEEGKMTYRPIAEYNKWRQCFVLNNWGIGVEERYCVIDWNRIDEIWVFEPLLFDGSLARPVKEIDLSDIFKDQEGTKKVIDQLNYIFDYQYKNCHFEIIYFDNYLSSMSHLLPLDAERYFLNKIIEITKGYDLYIKTHPGEEKGLAEIRFDGLDVKFIANNAVPWEVIYLNHILHNGDAKLVLLAASSSAVHNSFLIGKYFGISQCYLVLLVDLIKDYLQVNFLEEDSDYIRRFVQVYGRERVFLPQTYIEAKGVIDNIFDAGRGKTKENDDKDLFCEVKSELNWLKKQYVNSYKYLPNYICRSVLVVDYGNGYEWEKMVYQWFDTRKETFKLEFAIFQERRAKKVLWLPVCARLFGRVRIKEINLKTLEGETSIIPADNIRTDLPVDDDNCYVFNLTNPAIEIDVNKEIATVTIQGKIYFEDTYKKMVQFSEENIREIEIEVSRRTNQYYRLLINWFKLKQSKTSIIEYFIERNYQKVAIYGSGEIGKILYKELDQSPIQVVTFVNKNRNPDGLNLYGRMISIIGVDELLNSKGRYHIDAVIVTPIYDYQKIKNVLSTRYTSYQIISLDEIITTLLEKNKQE